jgi:hypothetical protein
VDGGSGFLGQQYVTRDGHGFGDSGRGGKAVAGCGFASGGNGITGQSAIFGMDDDRHTERSGVGQYAAHRP